MTRQHRTGNRRLLAAAAAAATVAALTAGCTSGSKNDKNAAPVPSLSPSGTTAGASPSAAADPEAADKTEVQAAYTRYWDVLTAAYAKPDPDDPNLAKVATGSALVQIQQDLANLRKRGHVFSGQPQRSNSGITFKADTKLKTAVITDCLDVSHWKPVEKSGGTELPLPSTRLLRYVNTVTAEKWPTGWMVLEDKQEGKAC
ncbi:hypothetical protein GCM10010302_04450 [Streptomyces polychromogenes]|uniref:Secreted protein/lipoprotein n=1 Tax=Streptomyces polychromogenes TaxID=67342 RepID=A0ABN0V193_9ACTN